MKKTDKLRPTTGKVREALFNILRGRIGGARFLDLYAGTGAVGIEALRQGASMAVFVERSRKYAAEIIKHLDRHRLSGNADVETGDVMTFLDRAESNGEVFDIIFLDPPYHTDEMSEALAALGHKDMLREDGLVVAEHFAKRQLPESSGDLHKLKEYRYGDTVLSFYEKQ